MDRTALFEVFESTENKYRFRLITRDSAGAEDILMTATDSYPDRASVQRAIEDIIYLLTQHDIEGDLEKITVREPDGSENDHLI